MSAASQTKIFGVRLGVDPKILVGGLVALAAFLFWYNSRGDEETGASRTGVYRPAAVQTPAASSRARIARRSALTAANRGTLRMRLIDATQGDVDPTLRLDLLTRLRSVKLEEGGRSLFEVGPPPMTAEQKALIARAPVLPPKPPPPQQFSGPPPLNIPLQYYGFVKGTGPGQANRGLFLDVDNNNNVLVASEGEVLKQRYLVVELAATGARMEDVQLKQGKTLPVVPVATVP